MKKLLFLSLIVSVFLIGGCQKIDTVDVPGNIPGMGENTDALEVKPVTLPQNVELVGVIKGVGKDENKSSSLYPNNKVFGSGCNYVTVEYTLRNNNKYPVTVFIPAGTIFKSNNAAYQHGILLQWVWAVIPAQSERTVLLHLYCVNWGKYDSDSDVTYQMLGQTLSGPMQGLLDLLKLKQINFEFYGSDAKSAVDPIAKVLQDAVWGLTNHGNAISSDVKNLIKALPDLDKSLVPEKMYNPSATLPVFFEEYKVK